ncbi:type I restriction modification DNA specificity domain protein [Streptococcus sp. AS14]|jgi:type I restriction modification DNA specificity domain protein|uniref:restriction endonuclease subunit S n=1 Tax=Streptococcus TaxID=1301 RepID=UPI000277FB49|nr:MULTISPECIES: restriction endonuclease subunit S [Streptococcus]EJO20502.1 type I restriction modification DNA specificity domain protein [Streptococcus sp. AS14]
MKYEKYKDCGMEWIGGIPVHWDLIKYKYFANLYTGNSIPDGEKYIYEEVDEGFSYISTKDVGVDRTIDYDNGMLIPFSNKKFKVAPQNSTIMCIEGGSAGIKKAFLDMDVCFGNKLCCFDVKGVINKKYVYYLLNSPDYEQYFKLHVNGLIGGVNVQILKNFLALQPPIDEQNTIVKYLDDKTSIIDSIIKNLESEKEKLEVYKRELIAEVVTKGLNSNIPMKDSGVDWIGQVPEHWEIHPLFSIFKQNKVKNIGMENDNLLSLSYGNIIRKDIDTTFGLLPANFENYQIVDKEYIILRLTDLQNDKKSLRTALVNEKGIITSAYIGLVKINSKCNTDYMHYLLHSYDLRKVFYSMGSGLRQSLNFDDIKRLPIVLPKDDEQKEIVEYLDYRVNKVESIKNKLQLQIEKLRDYRKILIHEAVTGKVKIDGGAK